MVKKLYQIKAEVSLFHLVFVSFHSDICGLQNHDLKTGNKFDGTRVKSAIQSSDCELNFYGFRQLLANFYQKSYGISQQD